MNEEFFSAENIFGWFVAPLLVTGFLFVVKIIWNRIFKADAAEVIDNSISIEEENSSTADVSEVEKNETIEQFLRMLYSHIMSYEITGLVILALPLTFIFMIFLLIGFGAWIFQALAGEATISDLLTGVGQLGSSFGPFLLLIVVFYWLLFGPLIRSGVANYFWHLANQSFPSSNHKRIIADYCSGLVKRNHRYSKFLTCSKSREAIERFGQGRNYGKPSGITAREYVEQPSNFRS